MPDRDLKLGILLWSQAATWPEMLDAAKRVDRLGYDHLWTWDHLYAIFGDPYQPIFEGWTALAAWAMATERTRLGLLVGREHVPQPRPGGEDRRDPRPHQRRAGDPRASAGAWMELEHQAHGIDFGSGFGQRLDWLDESVGGDARDVLDGEPVTSAPGGRYAFDDLRHSPLPVQRRLPIMIGGSGEKKTLRTVARYADMWNAMGTPELMAHKVDVLREHCAAVGRDLAEIEFTLGVQADDPRHPGGGGAGLARGDGPQPDAAERPRGRRHVLARAPRRRSPTGSGRTSSSASGPSSPSSRRPTTSRRSSASSAR